MIADNQQVSLTPNAHLVYSYLSTRPNCIVAYREFETIGISFKSKTFTLANYISQIRSRVPGVQIYNVHGVGYMLKVKQ